MTGLRAGAARLLRRCVNDRERGAAIVEFVLLVVVVFVPLTYGVIAFASVQKSVLAATEAARQAGRAIATASDGASGTARAQYAATLAAASHGIDAADVQVWSAPADGDCDPAQTYAATLAQGERFAICVQVTIRIPLMPDFIDLNTATGKYVVALDSFR